MTTLGSDVGAPALAADATVRSPRDEDRPLDRRLGHDEDPTTERDWVTVLGRPGPDQDEALRDLHAMMVRASRHQVWRMRGRLPGFSSAACDDLAMSAANDALTTLLGKVHTFEGRSRFTTWAYKFAILQAATEVRRQSWSSKEMPLDDAWSTPARGAGPEQAAEASDLAAEVGRAMNAALTAYQRKIAVALLIDQVPIDVLAERLGTNRGALYKTLHVARGRLREHLTSTGHLTAARTATRTPGTTITGTTTTTGRGQS